MLNAPNRHRSLTAPRAIAIAVAFLLSLIAAGPAVASPFTDYTADPSLTQKHADVFRLYWAFFDREPDLGGAQYWIGQSNQCTSLTTIAWSFEQSTEFRLRYGAPDNAQLVELVYNNVLHRESDPDGAAYWLSLLSNGTLSRTTLVLQFSLSAEFRNAHPLPSDGRADGGCTPPAPSGSNCDPNYSDCVPISSDVDCAGGTGNGPAYLVGTARVIGSDVYGLDGDNNGIACDGVR